MIGKIKCLLILLLTSLTVEGQNIVSLEVKNFVFPIDDSKPKALSRIEAVSAAQVQALEDKFGRIIFQGNKTLLETRSGQKDITTTSEFISTGDSFVKGEWTELLPNNVQVKEEKDEKGGNWFLINLKGQGKEITQAPLEFEVHALDQPKREAKEDDFNDNADFYMYFKSPVKGYVTIYLEDSEGAYRLLPLHYERDQTTYPVEGNQDNIFFQRDEKNESEYQLHTSKPSEYNYIYLIFSPEEFNPPVLEGITKAENGKYDLPPSLSVVDFRKWLGRARTINRSMQVKQFLISIHKEP